MSRRSARSPGYDEVSSAEHQDSERGEHHIQDEEDDESRDVVEPFSPSPSAIPGTGNRHTPHRQGSEYDMMSVDIMAESGGWDTDLEVEGKPISASFGQENLYLPTKIYQASAGLKLAGAG